MLFLDTELGKPAIQCRLVLLFLSVKELFPVVLHPSERQEDEPLRLCGIGAIRGIFIVLGFIKPTWNCFGLGACFPNYFFK